MKVPRGNGRSLPVLALWALMSLAPRAWAQDGHWGPVVLGPTDNLNDVFFFDADTGWVVGDNGTVWRTTTGGEEAAEWVQASSVPSSQNLLKVQFIDPLDGFAVGDAGEVWTSADGGDSWTVAYTLALGYPVNSVHFDDLNKGWVTTTQPNNPLFQTSGGPANLTNTSQFDGYGQDVFSDGAGNVWCVATQSNGFLSQVWESGDGGMIWSDIGAPWSNTHEYYAVGWASATNVWVVGQAGSMRRGPSPWQAETTLGADTFFDIAFAPNPDDAYGFVVGANGAIYGTVDGGDNWTVTTSNTSAQLNGVAVQGALRAWAVGNTGTLLIYRECIGDGHCAGSVIGCIDYGACLTAEGVCGTQNIDGVDCDDGNPCTDTGSCLVGICQPGAAVPDMTDCGIAGKCCSGACADPGECCINADCNDGDDCTDDQCNTNACAHPYNSAPCNDGDACTHTDTCASGACAGTAYSCDDTNPCTDDACNGDGTCTWTNNSNACDDGDACTQTDHCSGGACSGTAYSCDDTNPCTDDACNGDGTCTWTNNSDACDDGDACTHTDHCSGGGCAGTSYGCNDGDVCTDDVCDGAGDCDHPFNTAPCDDGDACTHTDTCAGGACVGVSYTCNDDNVCTADVCDGTGGCSFPARNGPCDDGDPCSSQDGCLAGQCESGPTDLDADADGFLDANCPGGRDCKDDDAAVNPNAFEGPANDPKCADGIDNDCDGLIDLEEATCVPCSVDADCDDGDVCNGQESCVGVGCQAGTALSCGDGNVCTNDDCDPDQGCIFPPVPGNPPCDDGFDCTADDICADGACHGTHWEDCSVLDGQCRVGAGSCNEDNEYVCVPVPINTGQPCDDGDLCTLQDTCADDGFCRGEPMVCPACQICDGDTGACVLSPFGTTCADDDGCDGVCDEDGACVVEAWCAQDIGGCEQVAPLPANGEVDCRLEPDVVRLQVSPAPGGGPAGGLSLLRVDVARGVLSAGDELLVRLDLRPNPELATERASYVVGSAAVRPAGVELEEIVLAERAEVFFRLSDPDGLPAGPDDGSGLSLELGLEGPADLDPVVRLDVWAPCGAAHTQPGCHLGFGPEEREDISRPLAADGGALDLQRISDSLAVHLSGREADSEDIEELSNIVLGCGCGSGGAGGPVGLVLVVLFIWGLRRRRLA